MMMKKVLAVVLSAVLLLGCGALSVGAATVTVSGTDFIATLDAVDSFMATKTPAQRQTIYDFLEVYISTDAGMDTFISLVDDQSEVSQLVQDYIQAYGVSGDEKQALKMYLTLLKCVPTEVRRTAAEQWHDRVGYEGYNAAAAYGAGTTAIRGYLLGGSQYETDGVDDAVFYNLLNNLRDMFVLTADLDDPSFDYEFYGFSNIAFANNIENLLVSEFTQINGVEVVSAEHFMMLFCDIINEDTNITAQMKKDFAETLVTTNSFVYASEVEELSVSTTDLTTQTIGSLSSIAIDLTATMADPSEPGFVPAVEWYVNDELVQYTGDSFTFMPSVAGTYMVYAKCGSVQSNAIAITINAKSTVIEGGSTGSGTTGGATGSGTAGTGGTGTGSGTGTSTVPPAKPNVYPTIPAPTSVGFVMQNGTTTAISGNKVSFEDTEEHWAEDYVEVLATAGFLRGHSETQFRPDLGVTREEMAVILSRVLGLEGQKAATITPFSDHESIQDFAVDAVYKMVEMGIYKGYGEGHFAPQDILTREEICALFSRVLGTSGLSVDKSFADQYEIKQWFVADVENLVNYGVVTGYPDASFRPENDVTRAEAAVMLYNTLYRLGIIK